MELRERIAFAIWNDTNPAKIRDKITPENLPTLTTDLGDGWRGHQNLALDWKLNRNSFLKLADIGLAAIEKHDHAVMMGEAE